MDKSDRIEQIYLIVGHIEGRMDNFGDLSKRVATLVAGQRGTARNGRESFQSLFRISNRLDPGFQHRSYHGIRRLRGYRVGRTCRSSGRVPAASRLSLRPAASVDVRRNMRLTASLFAGY